MSTTTAEFITTAKGRRVCIDPLDSPACAMAQYATYETRHWLVSGSVTLTAADTLDEIIEKADIWGEPQSRIVRVPTIPFYDTKHRTHPHRPVGRAPWAGGTWGGKCGSMLWVVDTERRYQRDFGVLHALDATHYIQADTFANDECRTTQAWWINGVAARHPEMDGFFVECQQEMRHLGLCAALDLTWDWRDYAPYSDQGNDIQLSLI